MSEQSERELIDIAIQSAHSWLDQLDETYLHGESGADYLRLRVESLVKRIQDEDSAARNAHARDLREIEMRLTALYKNGLPSYRLCDILADVRRRMAAIETPNGESV